MKTGEKEILTIGDREVAISNPQKVLFPRPAYTKLDLVQYYLAVADGALRGAGGRPNVLVRYPNGVGESSSSSRSARRSRGRTGSRWSRSRSHPAARPKRSCRASRRRWRGWPISPASSSTRTRCAPRISIIPTSCASTSIPCRASTWPQIRDVAASCARRSTISAWSGGRRRRARAACTSTCGSSAAGRSTRCAAPRWRWRARSSAARRRSRRASGGRKSGTACSSTTTRTPRTAPWPRAYSVRPTPTRACRRRSTGTR